MEHIKKLIGQKIYLSPLQAEDAPQLCRWRNDLSMTQQLGSPTQLSSIESEVERIRQYNSGEEHHRAGIQRDQKAGRSREYFDGSLCISDTG